MRYLSYDEAADLLGVTRRRIQALVKTGELPRFCIGERARNGRPIHKIPLDAVQARRQPEPIVRTNDADPGGPHRAQSPCSPPLSNHAESLDSTTSATSAARPQVRPDQSPGQLALFDAGPLDRPAHLPEHIPITPDGLPDLPALRRMGLDTHVREYERRFRAVSRLRSLLAEAEYGQVQAARERVAEEYDVSRRTMRKWQAAVEAYGWAGLMPAWHCHRGESRVIPDELQRQILDAYAYQGRYSVAQIYERVVEPYCRAHRIEQPHPTTIRRFIERAVPPQVKVMAREGTRAWQEQHEAKVVRDLEAAGANGWWASDHRLADTMVLVSDGRGAGWPSKVRNALCPCGSGELRKHCCSVRRLWWTVTVDVASGAFVGWRFSTQPTAATVCHMLRQAILDWGLPAHWMRDNGKEFTAGRLDGPTLDMSQMQSAGRAPALMPPDVEGSTVWEQLGVLVVTTLPYSSWSKYIESLFGAFARRYENLLPGWTANRTTRKPEKLRDELVRGGLLTADEYVDRLGAMIREWNQGHPVGSRRLPPAAYYKDVLPRRPDPQTLAFLLQDLRQVKIRQGRILLDGHFYISDELAIYSGLRVDVLWDPGEPQTILVYPGDGRCISVAEVDKALYGEWGEANHVVGAARKAQRRFIREWAAGVKGACPVDGKDPFGAHRAVQQRLETARQAPPPKPRELTVAKLDEPKKPEPPPRRRTIYSDRHVDKDGVVRLAE